MQDSINQTEKITSRYFQNDSIFLGSHEIYIAKEKYLTQLDYFNNDGSLLSRNAYWMDPILDDVIVTTANEEGVIIGFLDLINHYITYYLNICLYLFLEVIIHSDSMDLTP